LAELIRRAAERGSIAAVAGFLVHYALHYMAGVPLWTELIGEWIMARTPNTYSVWLLTTLGAWAKPFALTGGLAATGFALSVSAALPGRQAALAAAAFGFAYGRFFEYPAGWQSWTFWLPAMITFALPEIKATGRGRRLALQALMGGATAAVAVESYLRDERLARRAVKPVSLWPFRMPEETFHPGWVRKAVTAIGRHYTMSKNSVDPAIDPAAWRLRITIDGREIASLRYAQILQVPRRERYVTLRCVSNTLKSDLMGTAEWSGFPLRQIVDPARLPAGIIEAAFIGVDGHGDSLPLDYAFSDEVMLAVGMNGETLNRAHGFPLRLLCPRYYGFKNVKWMGEIAFVSQPYYGTWPKMGYTKEPVIKIASFIDKARREGEVIRMAGVSFAGSRGIRAVEVRVAGGEWKPAAMENPLSPYTWTRWTAELPAGQATVDVEARAQDGTGAWQLEAETPLFPSGVGGPTTRKVSS
jgi:DMSO/TMAO reductase YedYZ molybdopterin-dependent catalytic subunit